MLEQVVQSILKSLVSNQNDFLQGYQNQSQSMLQYNEKVGTRTAEIGSHMKILED